MQSLNCHISGCGFENQAHDMHCVQVTEYDQTD